MAFSLPDGPALSSPKRKSYKTTNLSASRVNTRTTSQSSVGTDTTGLRRTTGDIDHYTAVSENVNLTDAAGQASNLAKKHTKFGLRKMLAPSPGAAERQHPFRTLTKLNFTAVVSPRRFEHPPVIGNG